MNPKEENRDLKRKLNWERKKLGLLELKIHTLRLEKRVLREALDRQVRAFERVIEEPVRQVSQPQYSEWVMKLASEEPFNYLKIEGHVRSRPAVFNFDIACTDCGVPAYQQCIAFKSDMKLTDTHKPRADKMWEKVMAAREQFIKERS